MAERRKGKPADLEPRFIGPPGRLRLAAVDGLAWTPLQEVHLPAGVRPLRGRSALRRGADPQRARLRLAADTPPGEYQVELAAADGRTQTARVSVQSRQRLRVVPAALRLAAAAGAKAGAELLLENRGNVPVEIGAVLVAGLFDDDGIEAAMAAAYNLESEDVNQIVAHAFDRLRQAHGGLLKLRVLRGAGVLAVGERRLLEIESRLGAKLAAGHTYHGVLELGGHGIAVEVQVLRNPSGVKP
jgi:hypothetical protein